MHLFIPVLLSVGLIQIVFGLAISNKPLDVQTKATLNDILLYPHRNDGSLPPWCMNNVDISLGKLEDCTKAGSLSIDIPKEKPKRNR